MNPSDGSSGESSDEEETVRDFDREAEAIINQKLLPSKSSERYSLVYEAFLKWKNDNKANSFEENVFICYFEDLQKRVKPNTLWSVWSMLKKMLKLKQKIDINQYVDLKDILKEKAKGYRPKKSLAFTWDQIMHFMKTANDEIHLGTKVLLVFGICGALRCCEFIKMKFVDVEDKNDKFIVKVQDTKTYIDRSFVIGTLFYSDVKKYISLRPTDEFTDRFFIQYLNGKCVRQVIGKNKIGSTPAAIATFLKLKDPLRYTGHCFRRTSATLLSNSGANMTMLKQLGGWKSDTVAAGYVADSIRSKEIVFQGITHENRLREVNDSTPKPSTSRANISDQDINQIHDLSELGLTYEDFCDSDTDDNHIVMTSDRPTVKFTYGKVKQMSSGSVLTTNKQNQLYTHFTEKPPVKLTFGPSAKRLKITDEMCTNNNNKENSYNQNLVSNKDSKVVFENCTINGNIINNYYYYQNKDANADT